MTRATRLNSRLGAADAALLFAPSSAGAPPSPITGSGTYDASRFVYNWKASQFTKTRSALAKARAGTGLCKIATIGNSITGGTGSGGAPNTTSYPAYARAMLATAGYPVGGTGWVCGDQNSFVDTRWTLAGGMGLFGSANAWQNFIAASTTASATGTFVSDVAGTVLELGYLNNSSGPFTITIDGATPSGGSVAVTGGASYSSGTVTPTTVASTSGKITVTGLANTTHTLVFTSTSATVTYLCAAQVRGTTGTLFSNFGVPTSRTTPWMSTALFYQNGPLSRALDTFDLVIIEPMLINDCQNGISAATSQANLIDIAATYQAAGSDVAFVMPGVPNPAGAISAATWAAERQAMYGAADAQNVPLVDIGDRLVSWATANTQGLMFDQYHFTAAGYADMALAVMSGLVLR